MKDLLLGSLVRPTADQSGDFLLRPFQQRADWPTNLPAIDSQLGDICPDCQKASLDFAAIPTSWKWGAGVAAGSLLLGRGVKRSAVAGLGTVLLAMLLAPKSPAGQV